MAKHMSYGYSLRVHNLPEVTSLSPQLCYHDQEMTLIVICRVMFLSIIELFCWLLISCMFCLNLNLLFKLSFQSLCNSDVLLWRKKMKSISTLLLLIIVGKYRIIIFNQEFSKLLDHQEEILIHSFFKKYNIFDLFVGLHAQDKLDQA